MALLYVGLFWDRAKNAGLRVVHTHKLVLDVLDEDLSISTLHLSPNSEKQYKFFVRKAPSFQM